MINNNWNFRRNSYVPYFQIIEYFFIEKVWSLSWEIYIPECIFACLSLIREWGQVGRGGELQAGYSQIKCRDLPFHNTINSLGIQEPIHPITVHLWEWPTWATSLELGTEMKSHRKGRTPQTSLKWKKLCAYSSRDQVRMKVTGLIGGHLFNSHDLSEASTSGIHLTGGQMTHGQETLILVPVSSIEPMRPSLNPFSSLPFLPFSLLLQGHLEEFL